MQNDKYAAHVYVNREVLSDKNIIRFSARVVFPDGAEIVKYLDAPNDREYNPNDDAMLLRVYPVLSILLDNGDTAFFDGKVSEGLLAGLYTANQYYNQLFNADDRLYHKINIVPAHEVPVEHKPLSKDSVIAFSGGVDASYLLLSHVRGLRGPRNTNIKTAIIFQNLEILSNDDEKYQNKFNICKETLEHFGIEAVHISMPGETQGFPQYKFNICAGLFLFANTRDYAYGLLGSGGFLLKDTRYTTDESTPLITDYLASRSFNCIEDGFDVTRTQKCKLIATEPIVMKNLITCFFTDYKNTVNCGHCIKCSRTVLNFWANGVHELTFINHVPSEKAIWKDTQKVFNSVSRELYWYYHDILDNTIESERKSYWYKKLKKHVYKRYRKSVYAFAFEPLVVAMYKIAAHIVPTAKWARSLKRRANMYPIKIREQNVLLDAPNSYTYQMDFSRYMHALKSDSIKAKNNG